jgi:hypothetical protein
MTMRGFGTLQTPRDLLEQVRRQYAELLRDPANDGVALNFFINAYHVLDWVQPGRAKAASDARRQLERGNLLLQILSHIANGSKHFVAEDNRHQHVTHVDIAPPAFQPSVFQANAFQTTTFLVVTLDGQAAAQFGPKIAVSALAKNVLEFWDDYFQQHGL